MSDVFIALLFVGIVVCIIGFLAHLDTYDDNFWQSIAVTAGHLIAFALIGIGVMNIQDAETPCHAAQTLIEEPYEIETDTPDDTDAPKQGIPIVYVELDEGQHACRSSVERQICVLGKEVETPQFAREVFDQRKRLGHFVYAFDAQHCGTTTLRRDRSLLSREGVLLNYQKQLEPQTIPVVEIKEGDNA